MGGHFARRRQILSETLDFHQVPEGIKSRRFSNHTDTLRSSNNSRNRLQCDPNAVRDRVGTMIIYGETLIFFVISQLSRAEHCATNSWLRRRLSSRISVKLADLYARSGLTLSVEFFPPKTEKGEETLFSEIAVIKRLNPGFCSVTYGAGGSTREKTVDLIEIIQKRLGLEAMCHLTVVSQSKDEARAVLKTLKEKGIENLLALGGDPPQGISDWQPHPDGFHYAIELVREAVVLGGFSIAVAGFPEFHPRAVSRDSDLKFLKEKVDAGADAIITQLFFDNDDYFRFVDDLRKWA